MTPVPSVIPISVGKGYKLSAVCFEGSPAFGGRVRIGFDAREMGYRGIGTYSRNLLHFAATDIEFVVFCQDEERDTFLPVDSFTFVSANMNSLARHSRSAFHRLVAKSGVDLLTCPVPGTRTPSPVPLVATIHDVTPLLYPRSLSPTLRMNKRQLTTHSTMRAGSSRCPIPPVRP